MKRCHALARIGALQEDLVEHLVGAFIHLAKVGDGSSRASRQAMTDRAVFMKQALPISDLRIAQIGHDLNGNRHVPCLGDFEFGFTAQFEDEQAPVVVVGQGRGIRNRREGRSAEEIASAAAGEDGDVLYAVNLVRDRRSQHGSVGVEFPEQLARILVVGLEHSQGVSLEDEAACGAEDAPIPVVGNLDIPGDFAREGVEGSEEAFGQGPGAEVVHEVLHDPPHFDA